MLLETLYLSLDPYMRWRMSAAKSYAEPVAIGEVMIGGTVARVTRSRHPDWREGDIVLSRSGWQSHAISDGDGLRRLDPTLAPPSTALGVLGMTGFTAYAGLLTIGRPEPGEEHLRARYLLDDLGLKEHIDRLYYSAALGLRKPDTAFFEEVASRSGLEHGEIVLIDDVAANVSAARLVGWQAVLWTGQHPLSVELARALPTID